MYEKYTGMQTLLLKIQIKHCVDLIPYPTQFFLSWFMVSYPTLDMFSVIRSKIVKSVF